MTTEFTPGPWKVSQPTDDLHAIRGPNGRIVADVGYSGSLDGDAANASVIAATPDLIMALLKIASASPGEGGCYYTNRTNIHIARQALIAAGIRP